MLPYTKEIIGKTIEKFYFSYPYMFFVFKDSYTRIRVGDIHDLGLDFEFSEIDFKEYVYDSSLMVENGILTQEELNEIKKEQDRKRKEEEEKSLDDMLKNVVSKNKDKVKQILKELES